MASSFQLLINGQGADADFYALFGSIEVEESLDMPAALQVELPVSVNPQGDLTYVSDAGFAPMSNLALVATPSASGGSSPLSALASGNGLSPQCIFDGYVLSQKLHL